MLLLIWRLNFYALGAMLVGASCKLSQLAPEFIWKDGKPMFIDSGGDGCQLSRKADSNNKGASNNAQKYSAPRIKVLSFGDSFELGFCVARPSGKNNSIFADVKHNNVRQYLYVKCSFDDEQVHYMLRRLYGQAGDTCGTSWEHSSYASHRVIAESAKMLSNLTTQGKVREGTTSDSEVDVVIHGSFLWDLKHSHFRWCTNQTARENLEHNLALNNTVSRLLYDSLCNHVKGETKSFGLRNPRSNSSSNSSSNSDSSPPLTLSQTDTELIIQAWSRMTVPWCDAAWLRSWKQTFLAEVTTILRVFPRATLFLRTQAISSAAFLGNFRCYQPMNSYIIHLVEISQREQLKIAAISKNDGHVSSGFHEALRGRRLRLIDMYGLFAEPNDNGVDHFAADDIHLSTSGFKVYRGYVLRVVEEHLKEMRRPRRNRTT